VAYGGTALSKAHNLILRFSEDVDFIVIAPSLANESKSKQRKILSDFKDTVIANLKTAFHIDDDKVFARNGNQFVAIEIDYPTLFPRADALRPHILVEFTVAGLVLPAIQLPVSSFVNELSRQPLRITDRIIWPFLPTFGQNTSSTRKSSYRPFHRRFSSSAPS
jgi:hypothetical protein